MVVRGQVEIDKNKFETYPDIGYSFCNCHNIFYTNYLGNENPIEVLREKCDSIEPGTIVSIITPDSFFVNWENVYEFKNWLVNEHPIIWDIDSLCEVAEEIGFSICAAKRSLSTIEIPQMSTVIMKKKFSLVGKDNKAILKLKKPTLYDIEKINYDDVYRLHTTVEQSVMMSGRAGIEHYRLLAWIGYQMSGKIISEIGTMHGCGLAALALNPLNEVYSYDIAEYGNTVKCTQNAHRMIVGDGYMDNVIKSDIIHYDAAHEGKEEQEFYDELIRRNWKGVLFLDDIYLNKPMNDFWEGITHRKEDWTDLGHDCGTGVVFFE